MLLPKLADFLLDTVTAFPAAFEADQMPVRILAFHGAQGWRDLPLLPLGDAIARCFDSVVISGFQDAVAVSAPGTRRILGPVDRWPFLRRPFAEVLTPHPAEFHRVLVPFIFSRPLLGRGPLLLDGLLHGNSATQFDVIILPKARLGWAATALMVPTRPIPVWRHVAVTWPVACHRTP